MQGLWALGPMVWVGGLRHEYMSYSLNSLKGILYGNYIGFLLQGLLRGMLGF